MLGNIRLQRAIREPTLKHLYNKELDIKVFEALVVFRKIWRIY